MVEWANRPKAGMSDTAVEVSNVTKSFGDVVAAAGISFEVARGEIFGLIGPNGSGKTTIIRMIMEIIRPDSGQIRILGEPARGAIKGRTGYLPEERGLYKKLTVDETLSYLSALKGKSGPAVRQRAAVLLERTGMLAQRDRKIEELSKGMAQLIQFVATIIHDPDLVILDEPFYGLDLVNTRLLKDMIGELRRQGRAVILSTHMMNEVEELCDRIMMVNKGRPVLYGNLSDIKARYRTNSVVISVEGDPGPIEGVTATRDHGPCLELMLDGRTTPQAVLAGLVGRNVTVNRFEVAVPPLSEIFIQVVREQPDG